MHTIPFLSARALILSAVLAAGGAVAPGSADAASPGLTPSIPGTPSTPASPSIPDNSGSGAVLQPPSIRVVPQGAGQPATAPAAANPSNAYVPPSQAPSTGPGSPYYQRETDPGPARRGDAYDVKPLYPR